MTDFIHTHINAPSSTVLRAFPTYAKELLRDAVQDITDSGADRMLALVPRKSGSLANAIETTGPSVLGDRILGTVFVNPFEAPYADYVDRGTGIDGPYMQGVILTRPSRSGKGAGAMKLPPKTGFSRYQRSVKVTPSRKIEQGKNFSGQTYDHMKEATAAQVGFIASSSIPNYFRAATR